MNNLKIFFLFLIFFYPINSFADKEIVFVNLDLIIQKSYSKILIFSDYETRKYCLPLLKSKIESIIELTETHNYSIDSGKIRNVKNYNTKNKIYY